MKYKYNTFSSLPRKDKRLIAMAFRAYILTSNAKRELKKVEFHPKVEALEVNFGLPDEAIKQFQKLCEQKGLYLSDIDATKEAHNLINLYKILT